MRKILIFIFLLNSFSTFSQREFGLEVTKELCSEKYHGRGYVNDGHLKAANYIKEQFKSYGLIPLGNDYFQEFNINVNTFPNDVIVSIDEQKLDLGNDFIIDAISGSAKEEFTPVFINSDKDFFDFEYGTSSRENKVLVIKDPNSKDIDTNAMIRDWKYKGAQLAPVIFLTDKKFTWTVGRTEFPNPIIELRDSLFGSKINESSKIEININNEFKPQLTTQNVIGKIEGRCKSKTVVVSAHYDHLGRLGNDAYFPGANDNASGTAMMLYLAKYYSEHKPKCNIVFMSFGAEEVGILGSKYYTEHPKFPLKKIKFLINLDILGTGEEGITVVNGAVYKKQFKKLSKLNLKKKYLKKVKVRGRAANSDHYWFSELGVPSIFIYTMGGVSYYHDVHDCSETLPLNEFDDLAKLLTDFIGIL